MNPDVDLERERRWLAMNLRRMRWSMASDEELVDALGVFPNVDDQSTFLNALERRVQDGEVGHSLERFLLGVLEDDDSGIPPSSVDRLVFRAMRSLGVQARSLADMCASSDRRVRRTAAWKYYIEHGISDVVREVIYQQCDTEHHREFRRMAVQDAELVRLLGLRQSLNLAPSRYLRSSAIELSLPIKECDLEWITSEFPDEFVWAVSRAGAVSHLDDVLSILDDNLHDLALVNHVLLCLEALRADVAFANVRDVVETLC